jgi:hypothetical protein
VTLEHAMKDFRDRYWGTFNGYGFALQVGLRIVPLKEFFFLCLRQRRPIRQARVGVLPNLSYVRSEVDSKDSSVVVAIAAFRLR